MAGAIVGKVIKPARLKEDAMRLKLLNAMRSAGRGIRGDFQKTTVHWKHKVNFELTISLTGPGPFVLVETDDEIYNWVVRGTGKRGGGSEYEIWAGAYTGRSDKTMLFFSSQFVPKTQPGIIGSNPGFVGKRDTLVPMVVHPGIEPRNFDKIIQKDWEPKFKRQMEAAMREAAQASGHGAR